MHFAQLAMCTLCVEVYQCQDRHENKNFSQCEYVSASLAQVTEAIKSYATSVQPQVCTMLSTMSKVDRMLHCRQMVLRLIVSAKKALIIETDKGIHQSEEYLCYLALIYFHRTTQRIHLSA